MLFLFLFHNLPPSPQNPLTCVGCEIVCAYVEPVQICQSMFPSFCLSVVSLATWRLEAAALIETHPFTSTSSSDSLSLSFKSPSFITEMGRGMKKHREREEVKDGGQGVKEMGGTQQEEKDRMKRKMNGERG